MSEEYVLLIEDNPDNALMMRRLLETNGLVVKHFERGLPGAKQARTEEPQLILIDFNLPDIDGRTLVLSLRRSLPRTPIIAVTARASNIEENLARRFGCNDFIRKPFDPEDFITTVRTYLEAKV